MGLIVVARKHAFFMINQMTYNSSSFAGVIIICAVFLSWKGEEYFLRSFGESLLQFLDNISQMKLGFKSKPPF
jgi:hypothetical protein